MYMPVYIREMKMGMTLCAGPLIIMFTICMICMDKSHAKNRNVLILIGMYKTEKSSHRDVWDPARNKKHTRISNTSRFACMLLCPRRISRRLYGVSMTARQEY